jgi:hypothetical protein
MRHRTKSSQDGNKILLFGGEGSTMGELFNDLHLLDLKKSPLDLQQLTAAGDPPSPLESSTLTAVCVSGRPGTDREVVVVFGGFQGDHDGGVSDSLYILQGDDSVSISDAASQHTGLTWTEPIVHANSAEDGVPDARWGHSAVSWRGKLVLFGGCDGHYLNDTWILDVSVLAGGGTRQLLATWMKLQLSSDVRPPCRMGHTCSLVGDTLYVFGGSHSSGGQPPSTASNDIWKLDLSAAERCWEQLHISGPPPAPRSSHAAMVLGDRIVFSGGQGPPTAGAIGKYNSYHFVPRDSFFAGGIATLDITRGRWLPIQHPKSSVHVQNGDDDDGDDGDDGDDDDDDDDGNAGDAQDGEQVWEHRVGHVMVPAPHGLLIIGGLGYHDDREVLNDVLHVKLI